MRKLIDIVDRKFGKLTALKFIKASGDTKGKWLCKCECGIVKIEFDSIPEAYTSHEWIAEQNMDWGKE